MSSPATPRLSASTLGAPGEALDTVIDWLSQTGVDGIELRLGSGQILDPAMTKTDVSNLRHRLDDEGITVTGIASYVRMASAIPDDLILGALASAMGLAAQLGAPTVRVFPGAEVADSSYTQAPKTLEPLDVVDARAARRLTAVAGLSEELGVHPALETHDSHPRGADVQRVLQMVDSPVGAIWDLMHPWRVGEDLHTTWEALSPWLVDEKGSVQVKDANLPADRTPVTLGSGTLPIDDFAALLIEAHYDGVISLELERAWFPDAPRLDIALDSTRTWYEKHWSRQ